MPSRCAARLDLVLRLFARAVEDRAVRLREVRRRLQQQRRLADARLAADQDRAIRARRRRRARDRTRRSRSRAARRRRCRCRRTAAAPPRPPARSGGCTSAAARDGLRHGALLDERVPRAAFGAAAQPLLRPARRTPGRRRRSSGFMELAHRATCDVQTSAACDVPTCYVLRAGVRRIHIAEFATRRGTGARTGSSRLRRPFRARRSLRHPALR